MVNLVWNEEDAKRSYIAQGRKEGLEEGLEEGRKEGRKEGLEKGLEKGRQNLLNAVRNLMKNFKLSTEAAMNALGISPEMQKELAPLL